MTRRITDLDSPEFAGLFRGPASLWYRLERHPWYGVGYEDATFAAWQAGRDISGDPAREAWTAMVAARTGPGAVFQRVHLLPAELGALPASTPAARRLGLTDYLAYEFTHWYPANIAAGDDVRIWEEPPGGFPAGLPGWDYWLIVHPGAGPEVWAMIYGDRYRFDHAEQVTDPARIEMCCYWADVALHEATPFTEWMRGRELAAAS